MSKLLLLDTDSIVYRAGFAGQVTSLQVVFEDKEGVLHTRGFLPDPKLGSANKQLKAFIEESGAELLDSTPRVDVEPLENVLHSVKHMIEETIADTKCDSVRVFLTGHTNFRDAIATIRPYKGNRDKLERPVHYEAIREYLIKYWKAEVIEGEEADDRISIIGRQPAHRDKSVIASIDKDLDQIPGMHYDFVKRVSYDVRDDEADFCFYRQCLSGDLVDNVPGCYKIGATKAERILEATPRDEWWTAIVEAYANSQKIEGCPYKEDDPARVAVETAQLVRLRTFENELWEPPK